MSYTALYRKFRPSEFDDVKGQDHIVRTLQNQISGDRMGHAYLFCGTRGTGKTTIAKIFAKAVNCEHPVNGSPCGECAMCKAIASGSSMNVIEIDAASNNGVQNIRDIIEEVTYAPTEGRFKVYIIDEVHMLSTGAFNALLKTLEEPPAYVIFILATTEVHKIPITILSRCQRYDFRRISIDTITSRLSDLMKVENIDCEERGLRYVAKAADGSMRDALSLLDQCIAFCPDQELTYEKVLEVLGAVDTEVFSRLLRHIIAEEVAPCISMIEEVVIEGRELTQFVTDFTWYIRNLLLLKTEDNLEDILDISADNLALLKEEAQMVEPDILVRYLQNLSALAGDMKYSAQKRVLLEVGIIKLCKPQMQQDYNSLVHRIESLEDKLVGGYIPAGADVSKPISEPIDPAMSFAQRAEIPDATPDEIKYVCSRWKEVVGSCSPALRQYLRGTLVSVNEQGELMIVFNEADRVQQLMYGMLVEQGADENDNTLELYEKIFEVTGVNVSHIDFTLNKTGRSNEASYTDAAKKFEGFEAIASMGIEIETEDIPGEDDN